MRIQKLGGHAVGLGLAGMLALALPASSCRPVDDVRPVPACAAGSPLSQQALRETVEALAGPELAGRAPGTAGDRATRAWIEARFECIGLETEGGAYQQAFETEEGAPTANVIGVLRGSDPAVADEVVVIGAHHDHLGTDETGIYAGANDNASGVALMVGLAEVLAAQGTRRTVVFAAFGAEELGFLGSQHFVDQPPGDLAMADVVFMINLDMVGRYGDEGVLYALHTFEGTPGHTLLEPMLPEFSGLDVVLGEPGADADHLTFCEAGVPVTFFFTEDSECYHQTCDVPEHLDWPGFERVAALVGAFAGEVADTELDLAAAREDGCGAE